MGKQGISPKYALSVRSHRMLLAEFVDECVLRVRLKRVRNCCLDKFFG